MSENSEKSKQLGMSFSTASSKLRKEIMFRLVQKCGLDICYRCNEKIENVDDFSIEHKEPWLHSEEPNKLFFDMNNIAFSHTHCNYINKRQSSYEHSSSGYKGVHYDSVGNRKSHGGHV